MEISCVYTFRLIIRPPSGSVRTEKIKFSTVIVNIQVETSVLLHELIMSDVRF